MFVSGVRIGERLMERIDRLEFSTDSSWLDKRLISPECSGYKMRGLVEQLSQSIESRRDNGFGDRPVRLVEVSTIDVSTKVGSCSSSRKISLILEKSRHRLDRTNARKREKRGLRIVKVAGVFFRNTTLEYQWVRKRQETESNWCDRKPGFDGNRLVGFSYNAMGLDGRAY